MARAATNPCTGEVLKSFPDAIDAEVKLALDKARCFPGRKLRSPAGSRCCRPPTCCARTSMPCDAADDSWVSDVDLGARILAGRSVARPSMSQAKPAYRETSKHTQPRPSPGFFLAANQGEHFCMSASTSQRGRHRLPWFIRP